MDGPQETTNLRASQLKAALDYLGERQWRMAEVQCRVVLAVNPADIEGILILGLAIAADLVNRNGGAIALAPREPDDFYCGARFQITLPAPRGRSA